MSTTTTQQADFDTPPPGAHAVQPPTDANPNKAGMELYSHFLKTVGTNEKPCQKPDCPNFARGGVYSSRQKYFFCSDEHRKWWFRGHTWGKCAWCGKAIRVRTDNPKITNHFCNPTHNHLFRSEHIIRARAGGFMPVLKEYLESYCKIHYRRMYGPRNALSYFFLFLNEEGTTNLDQVIPKTITRFLVWESERGIKNENYLSYVSTFFDWLIAEDRRTHANPVVPRIHKTKRPKHLPRPYSDRELEEIWRLLIERGNARLWLVMALAEETGLRVSEICRLRLRDVDVLKQMVFVTTPNKTDRERKAFFHEKTVQYLQVWMQDRNPNCGHQLLLHNQYGNPCSQNALQLEFRRAVCIWERQGKNPIRANETGLDTVKLHRLRHVMATRMAAGGANASAIMAQGGWVTASAMFGYAEINPAQAARSYNEAMERAKVERNRPTPYKRVSGFDTFRHVGDLT